MVMSLTAKGLTTGEVQAHLAEVYGTDVSRETISKVTDAVLGEMAEWQNRPLDRVYPVVFIDAMVVKIRDGQVANRPIYCAVGVTVDGKRDILGLWAGTGGEGAKYWLGVLTETREPRRRRRLHRVLRRAQGPPRCDLHDLAARHRADLVSARWPGAGRSRASPAPSGEGQCRPSRRRPVPPGGDGPRTAIGSCASSAVTSSG